MRRKQQSQKLEQEMRVRISVEFQDSVRGYIDAFNEDREINPRDIVSPKPLNLSWMVRESLDRFMRANPVKAKKVE